MVASFDYIFEILNWLQVVRGTELLGFELYIGDALRIRPFVEGLNVHRVKAVTTVHYVYFGVVCRYVVVAVFPIEEILTRATVESCLDQGYRFFPGRAANPCSA